jgi:hypothetical protein
MMESLIGAYDMGRELRLLNSRMHALIALLKTRAERVRSNHHRLHQGFSVWVCWESGEKKRERDGFWLRVHQFTSSPATPTMYV